MTRLEGDPASALRLRESVSSLEKALDETRGELEMLRTRHEVDRQALELVRLEMAQQKERATELEEGLRFYRSLMAPDEVPGGLSIRQPELVEGARPGTYSLRLVVQQQARRHELVRGQLEAEVEGTLDGAEVSIPLGDLSADFSAQSMALQFRYYQSVEGELTLPDGMEPGGLSIVARASKPHKTEVGLQFPWRLQERFTHVGK